MEKDEPRLMENKTSKETRSVGAGPFAELIAHVLRTHENCNPAKRHIAMGSINSRHHFWPKCRGVHHRRRSHGVKTVTMEIQNRLLQPSRPQE